MGGSGEGEGARENCRKYLENDICHFYAEIAKFGLIYLSLFLRKEKTGGQKIFLEDNAPCPLWCQKINFIIGHHLSHSLTGSLPYAIEITFFDNVDTLTEHICNTQINYPIISIQMMLLKSHTILETYLIVDCHRAHSAHGISSLLQIEIQAT